MLNLTTYASVDSDYLSEIGDIEEDLERNFFYKYICKFEYGKVMWKPHKYSSETNDKIPFTKIDVNPKHFPNHNMFSVWLFGLFKEIENVSLDSFNISRIDLKSDVYDVSIDVVLARLYVMGYNKDSVSIIKGSTIYIGSNPKIRIYDKQKEIMYRFKHGKQINDQDVEIYVSGKQITRFEIEIRNYKGTLKNVFDDFLGLVSYFDRIKFYSLEDDDKIASMGGLQRLMSRIPRKYRAEYDENKDKELESLVRDNFIKSMKAWIEEGDGSAGVPF